MKIQALQLPLFRRSRAGLDLNHDLRLIPLRPDQSSEIFTLVENNRKHLEAWLSWIEQIKSPSDARRFLRTVRYKDIFSGQWVYGLSYQKKLIGLVDFNEGNRQLNQVAIGYWIAAEHQGKGFISRAVARCVQTAFEDHAVQKILIKCAVHNERSVAIARRLNFSWEGLYREAGSVKGQMQDLVVYALDVRDWRAHLND